MKWNTDSPPKDGLPFLARRKCYLFKQEAWGWEYSHNKTEELNFDQECYQSYSGPGIHTTDKVALEDILMWTRDYPVEEPETTRTIQWKPV